MLKPCLNYLYNWPIIGAADIESHANQCLLLKTSSGTATLWCEWLMNLNDQLNYISFKQMPPDTQQDIRQSRWWRLWCQWELLQRHRNPEIYLFDDFGHQRWIDCTWRQNMKYIQFIMYVMYIFAVPLGKRLISVHVGEKLSCATAHSWCWMDSK